MQNVLHVYFGSHATQEAKKSGAQESLHCPFVMPISQEGRVTAPKHAPDFQTIMEQSSAEVDHGTICGRAVASRCSKKPGTTC
jgi:hypothetical protein